MAVPLHVILTNEKYMCPPPWLVGEDYVVSGGELPVGGRGDWII